MTVAENNLASLADIVSVCPIERFCVEGSGEFELAQTVPTGEPFDLLNERRATASSSSSGRDVARPQFRSFKNQGSDANWCSSISAIKRISWSAFSIKSRTLSLVTGTTHPSIASGG